MIDRYEVQIRRLTQANRTRYREIQVVEQASHSTQEINGSETEQDHNNIMQENVTQKMVAKQNSAIDESGNESIANNE